MFPRGPIKYNTFQAAPHKAIERATNVLKVVLRPNFLRVVFPTELWHYNLIEFELFL